MNDDNIPQGKILIFKPASAADSPAAIETFKTYPGLQIDNAPEAFRTLLHGGFDLVVTTPEGFRSLQPNAHTTQLSAVLDAIGQGVCIVEHDGSIVWSNSKLSQFPEQVRERIQKYCIENYSKYDSALTPPRPRTLSF